MPQELHVVRCYCCETFQVQIVKKSNKWECKMCGEKQSVKKVYFKGSGKDCRLNVQKLNETRILNDVNKIPERSEIIEYENQNDIQEIIEDQNDIHGINPNTTNSKWDEFLPNNQESSEDEVEDSVYSFNRPNKRKSFTKKKNGNKKIKLVPEESADNPDNPEESADNDQNYSQVENASTSNWKNFISNIEKNSQSVLKDVSNNKPDLLVKDEVNKKSKWDCFVEDESDGDSEILDQNETNVSFNRDSKQSSSNIFSSDDNNLDDILQL